MKKIFLIYFFFFINLAAFAQDISLTAQYENNNIIVSLELESYNINEVIDSLEKGFEAEIFFEIRLYERVTGFLSLFGDKLIIEEKPYYIAGIDLFEKNFYITADTNEVFVFKTEAEFIQSFFKMSSYILHESVLEKDKEYYVLGRIQLNHVKLVPPLDLISLFYSTGFITDWVEIQLNGIY